MKTDVSSHERKSYFPLKDIINRLPSLKKKHKDALKAIAVLASAATMSTRDFPVTYERIQRETNWKSRSYTMQVVQEVAELTPYLKIEKQPYVREDGRKWNRANVYTLHLPSLEEVGIARKTTKKAPASSPAPIAPTPAPEPVEANVAPPECASEEYEYTEIPDSYYEALIAEYEAQEQSTISTEETHTTEPSPAPVAEAAPELHAPTPGAPAWLAVAPAQLPPEPIGTIDANTRVVTPQSPEGFTEEEQEVAHELKRYADAKLDPMCRGPKSSHALQAKLAFIGAMYSLGRSAIKNNLAINESLACVDEWIVKCLHPRVGYHVLALRLNKFLLAKAEHIRKNRLRAYDEFVRA